MLKKEFVSDNSSDEEYLNLKKNTYENAKAKREKNKSLPLKKRIWSSQWCYTSAFHLEGKHSFWAKTISTKKAAIIGLALFLVAAGGTTIIFSEGEYYGLLLLTVLVASVGISMMLSLNDNNWGKKNETSLGLILLKSVHTYYIIALVTIIAAVIAAAILNFIVSTFSGENSSSSSLSSRSSSSDSRSGTKSEASSRNTTSSSQALSQDKKSAPAEKGKYGLDWSAQGWIFGGARFIGPQPHKCLDHGGIMIYYNGSLRNTSSIGGVSVFTASEDVCVIYPAHYSGFPKITVISTGGPVQVQYL